jgi:chemotaxis protein methyltransferase WspC
MHAAPFEDLLNRAIGLNPASVGSYAIPRAVYQRMAACKIVGESEYLALALRSRGELQALIDAVVVPETWFFRHPQAFVQVVELFTAARLAPGAAKVRILSVPSSSGEEPYSIAMALLEAGVASQRFSIDAVDVSERSLELARRAIYRPNSFRGEDLKFRDRNFEPAGAQYRLKDVVREQVSFTLGNLLAPHFLGDVQPYDVIFCRNLLIYFDAATQHRAIELLGRLLAPDGILFVGPAEAGLMFGHGFVWTKVPLAFSFAKAPPAAAPPLPARSVARRDPVADRRHHRVAKGGDGRPAAPARSAPAETAPALEVVARLADSGDLDAAARSCDAHLRVHGPSARALHLRAMIYSAAENPHEAMASLRKALYLEPELREALVHLALLLEQGGDDASARLLRARVGRLPSNGGGGVP